jgi:DNA-binding NtrC family response regulator
MKRSAGSRRKPNCRLIGFAKRGRERQDRTMSDAPDSAPGENDEQGKDAVLLIDDEKSLLAVYAAALTPRFSVATACSVQEAESLLRKRKFKVVVSDHLMPGGNGMSFLVRTREEYPEMQRVLVTAFMKPEMLLRSVNEAALFRYLLKPISLAELVQVVEDAAKLADASAR